MTSVQPWLMEPSSATKRIIFARHGEYECNVRGVCNSDPRTPYSLTTKGQQQARDLAKRLLGEGIELVITSEFIRARETAWIVNQALGVPQVVNRLANENRVGSAYEGRPAREYLNSIAHSPATACAEDGESFMGLLGRVEALIADLRLSSPGTILVVAHGWTLQALRVLRGEISAADAAQNVGMPGNCQTIEGFF